MKYHKIILSPLTAVIIGIFSLVTVCGALSLSRVVVPSYKFQGESATLECPFELSARKRERLYAVKWYKDDAEFFRYVQKATPPIYTPPVVGIQVYIGGSDSKQVTLRNLDLRSTGVFRCEVSAEAPSFASAHQEGRMTVVHLPEEGPQIKGNLKEEYEVGDLLELNCSTSKSFPPARLYWFINDLPVSKDFVIDHYSHTNRFNMLSDENRNRDPLTKPIIHHLAPSLSSLRIPLGENHFSGDGESKVLCKANISPFLYWEDGDEKVVNPRKTDLRSNTNFNASPITLFDQDAQITLKGSAVTNNGNKYITTLLTSLVILMIFGSR